jgi:hypothetical protein
MTGRVGMLGADCHTSARNPSFAVAAEKLDAASRITAVEPRP